MTRSQHDLKCEFKEEQSKEGYVEDRPQQHLELEGIQAIVSSEHEACQQKPVHTTYQRQYKTTIKIVENFNMNIVKWMFFPITATQQKLLKFVKQPVANQIVIVCWK